MKKRYINYSSILLLSGLLGACGVPKMTKREVQQVLPDEYAKTEAPTGQTDIKQINWKDYFHDPYLTALVDTALQHNQELLITMQEIDISKNEVSARKGEYLPSVGIQAGAGAEKRSENTPLGALEKEVDIREGKENPDPMPDIGLAVVANWEVDIWHKLHNATKAAQLRYLSSIEGKNFMVTNLVAEIARSYYELLALDEQYRIVQQNIGIQSQALEIAKVQKAATRITELAVKKFEAELLRTQSLQYDIEQKIIESENRINYLSGRYPQHIDRPQHDYAANSGLMSLSPGLPSELLNNRADIRQAALDIAAADLDIKVAKARFYPSVGISASLGYQAFNPAYLVKTPQSLVYSLAGDLMAPLINKRAIQADYKNANAKQIQAVYSYEQTVLNAYVEVANQLANYQNITKGISYKAKQVEVLGKSIQIANDLFNAAHAEYMEVLMTQRDNLETKMELIEAERDQYIAKVDLYRSLGGGWQ